MSKLSVIGTGYLGATHAAAMADLGHEVVGIDIDPAKIAQLAAGAAPFYEPGLDELLAKNLASGRLSFTTDFAAANQADVHFICVGTPQSDASGAADTQYVEAAVAALQPHLKSGDVVVGKSTVPVGTAGQLAETLATGAHSPGLVWNPEFLREGFAVEDTLRPDRIVLGVQRPEDEATLRAVYQQQIERETPFIVTDFATAELVKVAANSFLATKISYINAMATVCDAVGADVTTLAEAIGYDDRIGAKFLRAGIGFGGGCLPKDIRAFMARAGELGLGSTFSFLRSIDEINMRRRSATVERAAALLGGDLLGARIAVLGVAFKPDSDDVRDSPALNIAAGLHLRGAQVLVYDPKANDNAAKAFPTLAFVNSAEEALADAELTMLLTEWDEFTNIDPTTARDLVSRPLILDGRNALSPERWRSAGWTYQGVGRPNPA